MDGWTSEFWNHHRPTYSHVDTFHAQLLDPTTVPNHAMWIGTTFDCAGTRNPGYGNSWDQTVDWYGTVADSERGCGEERGEKRRERTLESRPVGAPQALA